MKKTLLFSGALLALLASTALAGGINFAWGVGCWADNPVSARVFACTSNTGTHSFTGSFMPTNAQPAFVGVEVVVDLQAATATLPDWWQFFNAGSCRSTALSTSADFTTAPGGCLDPWFGLAGGGIAAYQTVNTVPTNPGAVPNRARLKVAYAVADPSPLDGGMEYYGFRGTFNSTKTVGTGACAGCLEQVTIVLNEIKSAENTGPFERINAPINNTCLTWQGGAVPCLATPATNSTWGQVKSLYR